MATGSSVPQIERVDMNGEEEFGGSRSEITQRSRRTSPPMKERLYTSLYRIRYGGEQCSYGTQ